MVERRSPKPDVVGSSPTWPGYENERDTLCIRTAKERKGSKEPP